MYSSNQPLLCVDMATRLRIGQGLLWDCTLDLCMGIWPGLAQNEHVTWFFIEQRGIFQLSYKFCSIHLLLTWMAILVYGSLQAESWILEIHNSIAACQPALLFNWEVSKREVNCHQNCPPPQQFNGREGWWTWLEHKKKECKTAKRGDACYNDVVWAMNTGFKQHPDSLPNRYSHACWVPFGWAWKGCSWPFCIYI